MRYITINIIFYGSHNHIATDRAAVIRNAWLKLDVRVRSPTT